MDSLNSKNIEKPFKVNQENLDGFNEKIKRQFKLTEEEIKKHLQKAEALSSGK